MGKVCSRRADAGASQQRLTPDTREVHCITPDRVHGSILRSNPMAEVDIPDTIESLGEDYHELIPEEACNHPCVIENTAERGISLLQLLQLIEFLRKRCEPDGTILSTSCLPVEDPLSIHVINLYHVVTWIVKPATVARKCSYVELVSISSLDQWPEFFVSHWWGEPVLHFVLCLQHFSTLRGGVKVFWICAYANNQHDLVSSITSNPSETSFFQAMQLSQGTVMILDENATPFWRVWCAYEISISLKDANRSLDLVTFAPTFKSLKVANIIRRHSSNLSSSGSSKLSRTCTADDETSCDTPAASHSRISLESSASSVTRSNSKLKMPKLPEITEIGLEYEAGSPCMISDQPLPCDKQITKRETSTGTTAEQKKANREASFSLDIIRRGLNISIQNAQASVEADKARILNSIANAADLDGMPPVDHASYHQVNSTMRTRFALVMLMQSVWKQSLEDFDRALTIIGSDLAHPDLSFSFPSCRPLKNDMVVKITEKLPTHIHSLTFYMHNCTSVGDGAIQALGNSFMRLTNIVRLYVNFSECYRVGTAGIQVFADGLQWLTRLRVLSIECSGCQQLSDDGIQYLATRLQQLPEIREFVLDIANCEHINDSSLSLLGETVKTFKQLTSLQARVGHNWEGDGYISAVTRSLPQLTQLTELKLCLLSSLSRTSLQNFGMGFARLSSLTKLSLNFDWGIHAKHKELQWNRSKKVKIDASMVVFAEGLRDLVNLLQLTLCIDNFWIWGDNEVAELGSALKLMTKLTELKISMLHCPVGEVGAKSLAASLARMSSLEKVTFSFAKCKDINNAALSALESSLFKLTALEEVKFNLASTQIDDTGLDSFFGVIAQLTSLLTLEVILADLQHLTDRSIHAVAHVLRQLKLDRLLLNLSNTSVTVGGVEYLTDLICQFGTLSNLTLNVDRTGIKTTDELQPVKTRLQNLATWYDNSSEFRLSFSGSKGAAKGKGKGKMKGKASEGKISKGRGKGDRGTGKSSKGDGKLGKRKDGGFDEILIARRIELSQQIDTYCRSDEAEPLILGSELTPNERRFIHHLVGDISGFVTQSFGEGDQRHLKIFRDAHKVGRFNRILIPMMEGEEDDTTILSRSGSGSTLLPNGTPTEPMSNSTLQAEGTVANNHSAMPLGKEGKKGKTGGSRDGAKGVSSKSHSRRGKGPVA